MIIKKIRIAIVDDHQIVIDGITALLNNYHSITIVTTSTSPVKMLHLLNENEVDILITDLMMPELSGQDLAKQVKENHPSIKILVLSMNGQGSSVSEMINNADIAGYVMKNISKNELINAVEKIAGGGIYFADDVLNELEKFSHIKKENEEAHLTAREVEIIKLMEKEFSNKNISDALFISERTVETHRKNIFRKTKTNSLVGLIKYAYRHNIIEK